MWSKSREFEKSRDAGRGRGTPGPDRRETENGKSRVPVCPARSRARKQLEVVPILTRQHQWRGVYWRRRNVIAANHVLGGREPGGARRGSENSIARRPLFHDVT